MWNDPYRENANTSLTIKPPPPRHGLVLGPMINVCRCKLSHLPEYLFEWPCLFWIWFCFWRPKITPNSLYRCPNCLTIYIAQYAYRESTRKERKELIYHRLEWQETTEENWNNIVNNAAKELQ